MVLQTAGWHDQIRGESAKKVRRHLSVKFSVRKLARAVGRDEEHRALLGRAWGAHLSRGQPAHKASRILGIFDHRRPREISRHNFSLRSVHPSKDDESARESR